MEECQTPTLAQMMEFKYELTPTMVFDPSRLQDAQNLFVNRMNMRCFTPTMKNFQSPGLSPINEIGVAVGVATNMENLQKSMVAGREEYFKVPFVKTKNMQQKQMQQTQLPLQQQQQQQFSQQQQQQQQQQQALPKFSCHFVSDSPPVFTLNSTTNSDTDFSLDSTSPDSSAILGIVSCKNNNNNNSNNNSTDYNNNNGNSDSPNSSLSSKCSNNATFTNSLNNNSNTNIDNNNNNNNTINNNSSASRNMSNTNLLDRTMNISTLLRSAGLDEYIDVFEEQNMDLEQFLNIRSEDFARMGVCKVEDQKTLADLLCELNGV